jgi:hypothetical protein
VSEATELVVGDVIEGRRGRRFYVTGFTSRGKTRLLRQHTGTEMTTWWRTREELPRGYRWAMWIGSGTHV